MRKDLGELEILSTTELHDCAAAEDKHNSLLFNPHLGEKCRSECNLLSLPISYSRQLHYLHTLQVQWIYKITLFLCVSPK